MIIPLANIKEIRSARPVRGIDIEILAHGLVGFNGAEQFRIYNTHAHTPSLASIFENGEKGGKTYY